MTLFTSGDWHVYCEKILSNDVFEFMCNRFPKLKVVSVVEVNQVDLSTDNAVGFCQVDGDGEFLIDIHNNLVPTEYAVTLMHELVHVRQTLDGLFDHTMREQEASIWEDILSKEFWDSYGSGTFFRTPWTHTVYNKKVTNQGGSNDQIE